MQGAGRVPERDAASPVFFGGHCPPVCEIFKMHGSKSLPVIDLAYRLTLEINRAVIKFPRHQRPGLGRRMEAAAFDLLTALLKARYLSSADPAKAGFLVDASQSLDTLRLLIRMSKDLAYLPLNCYEELARTLREVGRMVGGWQRNVTRKQSNG